MAELHAVNAVALLLANVLALGWGAYFVIRKRLPGRLYAHALALAQALVIAQVALGLLLLSDDRRTADDLHYLYGGLALLAALSPWLYAPPVPARRLAWFVGATLFATALSVRAYTTAT
jgi:EamA domain-containing membrane protein RarD